MGRVGLKPALWRAAHWAWTMGQEVGSLGLVRAEEDTSHVGKTWGMWAPS